MNTIKGEIEYINSEGANVHSDLNVEDRSHLHAALDEFLDKSNGDGRLILRHVGRGRQKDPYIISTPTSHERDRGHEEVCIYLDPSDIEPYPMSKCSTSGERLSGLASLISGMDSPPWDLYDIKGNWITGGF